MKPSRVPADAIPVEGCSAYPTRSQVQKGQYRVGEGRPAPPRWGETHFVSDQRTLVSLQTTCAIAPAIIRTYERTKISSPHTSLLKPLTLVEMWLSGNIITPIPQFERKDVLKPLFLVDRLGRDSARISFPGFDNAPPFYQPLEPQNLEVNILAGDISYATSAVLPSDSSRAGVVAKSATLSVFSKAKPAGSTRAVAFPSCMSTSTNMASVTKTARVAAKKPAFIIRGRGLLADPQVSLETQDMGSIAGSPLRGSRSAIRRAYVADEVNKSLTTQLSTVLGLNSRRSSNVSPFDQEGFGCIWRFERTPELGVKSELQRISEKANVARRRFSKLRRSRESWCMSMGVKAIQ